MSDTRLLLIKSITLLYRESLLEIKENNSSDLVRTVISTIKLPDISLGINSEREVLMGLKDTALYMCNNPYDVTYEKNDLLQRLKINCNLDEKAYDALEQGIDKDMEEGSLKRTIIGIRKYLNDSFRENEIINKVSNAANVLRFKRDTIKDIREYIRGFITELEPYQIETNGKDPAVIEELDLGDTSGLTKILENIIIDETDSPILITGWQDLNIMTQNGLRRGETVSVSALQHNYKTGFSLTIFKQLCIYNKPKLINPKKKPLMIRYSLEDPLAYNIFFLYENLKHNETGETVNIPKKWKSLDEMRAFTVKASEYVTTQLQKTGFHVKFKSINPTQWSLAHLQNDILKYEADGYEIITCMVDYLPMLPTTGCLQGPHGVDLQDMLRRAKNFFRAHMILFFTPWQISTEGKMEYRMGKTDFVKSVAGKGWYKGCKSLDQEIDLELHIHIESRDNVSYLTVQRGKHRLPTTIDDTEKYFALPFPKRGSILDDIDKEKISMRVMGRRNSAVDEIPFNDFI